ncbi:hypothetical protein BDP55DRAFT_77557 [Colletotrichum godetiae]|uniref:Uncharacterized protein n=1 Tax=Colletotrichum godetiae TaxID=1209918 RepID=A0AAJ0EXY1_9PEZI|nr:uncharacterized protein BDP55DRAFT_77557 [Colletotrichum godetiae]KAK1688106.1 hypothetical protein BDP55DRAFT_77557 [Colletotrichum godetiae]
MPPSPHIEIHHGVLLLIYDGISSSRICSELLRTPALQYHVWINSRCSLETQAGLEVTVEYGVESLRPTSSVRTNVYMSASSKSPSQTCPFSVHPFANEPSMGIEFAETPLPPDFRWLLSRGKVHCNPLDRPAVRRRPGLSRLWKVCCQKNLDGRGKGEKKKEGHAICRCEADPECTVDNAQKSCFQFGASGSCRVQSYKPTQSTHKSQVAPAPARQHVYEYRVQVTIEVDARLSPLLGTPNATPPHDLKLRASSAIVILRSCLPPSTFNGR